MIFFGTSILMMICIAISVFVWWLEKLIDDDDVIEELAVTRIRKMTVHRPENLSARLDAPIPRKMTAKQVQSKYLT